jgi:hypothetical protein
MTYAPTHRVLADDSLLVMFGDKAVWVGPASTGVANFTSLSRQKAIKLANDILTHFGKIETNDILDGRRDG